MPEPSPKFARPPVQIRTYRLSDGWTVLVGKTDADNDELTLRRASPNDWWFHVHGLPGSHVVLRSRDDRTPDVKTLKIAASIAAYHSKARSGGWVPVVCTQIRHVSKPRGARPGTVSIRKERIYKVRPGLPASVDTEEEKAD
ncbi:MAG: NFACT RNA binding domain-containing protein [Desulfobacterales bacterium]